MNGHHIQRQTFVKFSILITLTVLALSAMLISYAYIAKRNSVKDIYSSAIQHFSNRIDNYIVNDDQANLMIFLKNLLTRDGFVEYIIIDKDYRIISQIKNKDTEIDLKKIEYRNIPNVNKVQYTNQNGEVIFHLSSKLNNPDTYLHIGLSRKKIDKTINLYFMPLIIGNFIIIAVSLLITWKITRQIESKIDDMTNSLSESEKYLKDIFDSAPEAITISRFSDGKILDINNAFCRQTGYTYNEVIGKTAFDLGLWDTKKARMEFKERLKEFGFIENFELSFNIKDEAKTTVLLSANLLKTGKESQIITLTRAIDDFKLYQEESLNECNLFESVFRSIGIGLIALDGKNHITLINRYALHVLNIERNEAIGSDISEIAAFIDPVKKNEIKKLIKDYIKPSIADGTERKIAIKTQSGEIVTIYILAAQLMNNQIKQNGTVILMREYNKK